MTDAASMSTGQPAPEAVLIGGSAGAFEVVSQLLGALPDDFTRPSWLSFTCHGIGPARWLGPWRVVPVAAARADG